MSDPLLAGVSPLVVRSEPESESESSVLVRHKLEIHDNIRENMHWMQNSTVFLTRGRGSFFRDQVREAFFILDAAAKNQLGRVEDAFKFKFDLEDFTIGPAVRYAFKANYIIWGFFVLVAVFGRFLVDVDSNTGLAKTPQGKHLVVGITLMVVFLGLSLYYEILAAYYVLPTQGCGVDREDVGTHNKQNMRKGDIKFDNWMLIMLIVSFAMHTDIYFTSVFIARVVKSVHESPSLEHHWELVLEHSPSLKRAAGGLTFLNLVCIVGFLMFCQFLFALMYSWPVSGDLRKMNKDESIAVNNALDPSTRASVTQEQGRWLCQSDRGISMAKVKYEMVRERSEISIYHTYAKRHQKHGRALQALADSGRMNCLNWQDDYYLDAAEPEWDLQDVVQEIRRINFRLLFFALQAVLVPNLQVSFLGIQAAAAAAANHDLQGSNQSSGSDWLTFTSILFSVLMGLRYINYEYGCVKRHYKYIEQPNDAKYAPKEANDAEVQRAGQPRMPLAFDRAAKDAAKQRSYALLHDALYYKRRAVFSWWANRALFTLFICFFLQLLAKTFMAVFICDSHVWNINFLSDGEFDWKAGCVDFGNLTAKL